MENDKPVWNVILFDDDVIDDGKRHRPKTYNVFNNRRFCEMIADIALPGLNKPNLATELRGFLFNQFAGRVQYEFTMVDHMQSRTNYCDAYTQVMANIDIFTDYVWNHLDFFKRYYR